MASEGGGAAGGAGKTRPLSGFLIAGASLAMLFAIAALKGRVKDRGLNFNGGKGN